MESEIVWRMSNFDISKRNDIMKMTTEDFYYLYNHLISMNNKNGKR